MADSIKQRVGGSKASTLTKRELLKLYNATLTDLTALRSVVNNLSADANNVAVYLNNVRNDLVALSNNLNAANNTVQITANNTLSLKGGTSTAALTLVS